MIKNTDAFTWDNQYGGDWANALNWFDSTANVAAASAPGASGTVTIAGGTDAYTDITGTGAAASLAVSSDVLLWGTVAVGGALTEAASADLEMDGESRLTAGSIALGSYAALAAGDFSALGVTGAITMTAGRLYAVDGSLVQAGTLIANGASLGSLVSTVFVDSNSSIEVGTTGGAALGALTIDAGHAAAIGGTLNGDLVVNGTLGVQAGGALYLDQNVSGSGVLAISEGSLLYLAANDSAAIQFGGPNGKLTLRALPTGTISGFGATDSINVGALATGVSYQQTSATLATLTLTNGGTVVGTLRLAGNYAGSLFHYSPVTGNITLQTIGTAPVQPTTILGTAGADTLAATANKQVLTGLGGGDTLGATGFTGIDFKDTSADLSGSSITGFALSDYIDLTDMNPAKVTVSYTPPTVSPNYAAPTPNGTLTLSDGTHTATISLNSASSPAGYFAPVSDGAGGTDVSYIAVNTDAYAWNASNGGYYSNAAKWQDTTLNAVAKTAPGYGNAVTIAGGLGTGGFADIAGSGFAASLTSTGSVLLMGTLTVGSKVSGVSGALTQSGTLALDSHGSLALAGTATIGGLVEVGGGSTLTSSAVVFGNGGKLETIGGGYARFTTVNAAAGAYLGEYAYYPVTISVDAASAIEIGPYGTPITGALKIDSGVSAGLDGTINGNVVVNGTLIAETALAIESFGTVAPSVSGYGTLELTLGSTLALAGTDSAGILFTTITDTNFVTTALVLAGSLPTGTISGFAPNDVITVDQTVTRVSYSQTGSTGILTLFDGTAKLGTLTLSGTYAASQFLLEDAPTGTSASIAYIETPPTGSANQVSANSDTYAWNVGSGGAWDNAAVWTDSTTGRTPSVAPGINNAVNITNHGSFSGQIISGPGSAASLTVNTDDDPIFTGTLTVAGVFAFFSTVALEAGAVMSVGALDGGGTLEVGGGSTLTTGSYLYDGDIVAVGGSTVRVTGASFANIQSGLAVDGTSVFEFGTIGGATAGALTIDAGQAPNLESSGTIAGSLVVNGILSIGQIYTYYSVPTIEGFGGTVGSVSGTGAIDMDGGSHLVLDAADSAAITMFNPGYTAGDELELAGPMPTGTLSGFAIGDLIQIDHAATGISFSQTTSTAGVLTVTDGAATVGTINLAGSYSGDSFHLDVSPLTGVATISLGPATSAAAVGANNTDADTYAWSGASGGSWATAGNWADASANVPATGAPGSGDDVLIYRGTGQYTAIGGNGVGASLAITGDVLLTGTITLGGAITTAQASTLALDSGASLTAGSATLTGELEAGGASSVSIAGTATLAGGSLLALDGSSVTLGGLLGVGGTIAVDANSSIGIGTGAAAKGALTQQSGTTAVLTGNIVGSVVANGTLAVAAGGSLFIDLAGLAVSDPFTAAPGIGGTGTLLLTEGSTLGLGAPDSAAISFGGPDATLQVAALPTGTISGFAVGDQIQVDRTVTAVAWRQVTGTGGNLTLLDGTATVGTLALAGNYNGAGTSFHLDSAADGSSATISLQTVGIAMTQPSFIQGTAATDTLIATAASQTLTGLGGDDTLNGNGLAGIDFKDLAANLSGSQILNFATSDVLDFTDMNYLSANPIYTAGRLSVSDGTHSASLSLAFATTPASGGFSAQSDGAGGTKLVWHS